MVQGHRARTARAAAAAGRISSRRAGPSVQALAAACKIAHEVTCAEAPRLAVRAAPHAVDQPAKLRRGDGDDVADVMGKTLAGRVAVLGRREQRAEEKHGAIGILVVRPDHLANEVDGIAADAVHVRDAVEAEAVRPCDRERAYRSRALSPLEAVRDVLQRVACFEPHIQATYLLAPERSLAQARASEERWRRGEPVGPLDGVPVTIKDNIATKGEPVPLGTAATELSPAAEDAPPAARLREAGAIFFTKTTMPDYGMLSSGLSSFHPLTRNPWDLTRNPGGSSAGAGALAAACCGPLHLGTDIGGSVRLPAGWCGIFALKPSGGRVPIDPPYIGRVAGPMTRNVADAALMMATLAQPDARDFMSLPPQRLDWRVAPAKLAGLRIGVLLEAGCFATLPSTLEAAPSPALAERSGAPSGLRPSTFVMSDTPVEVQFTSAGCLNYPCRTPFSDRQLPAHHRRRRARRRSADTRCPKAAINSRHPRL